MEVAKEVDSMKLKKKVGTVFLCLCFGAFLLIEFLQHTDRLSTFSHKTNLLKNAKRHRVETLETTESEFYDQPNFTQDLQVENLLETVPFETNEDETNLLEVLHNYREFYAGESEAIPLPTLTKGELESISVAPRKPVCPEKFGSVAIFVVYTNYSQYNNATNTLRCYAESRGYSFFLVHPYYDPISVKYCGHLSAVTFRKMCTASLYLQRVDWLAVVDADTTIVNADHCIEDFLDRKADLIFYERFFSSEIMSGNFMAQNTPRSRRFLLEWSQIEKEHPEPNKYFFSQDNGALHLQLLRTLFPNNRKLHKECFLYLKDSLLPNFEPGYYRFVRCAKEALLRFKPVANESRAALKISARGQEWASDLMHSHSFYYWDGSFMAHSVKAMRPLEKAMLKRLSAYEHNEIPPECEFPEWFPALDEESLKVTDGYMREILKSAALKTGVIGNVTLRFGRRDFDCWPDCAPILQTY